MKKFEVVQQYKKNGFTVAQISEKTGWKYSTVYYHFDLNQKNKHTVRQTNRRSKIYEVINKFKTKCSACDETDIACLDFHHKDKTLKEFSIGSTEHKFGLRNIPKILNEIKKCIVLCANCHRKHHYYE